MTSEAKLRANKRYIEEKTDEIKIRVPKGRKAIIQAYVADRGTNVNAYINDLIDKDMNNK